MSDISPRIDMAFKKIFGVEENKDLLISLINSIVSEEDQVSDVTLLNPYNLKSFKEDKSSILDIKAKGVDGKRFNIEIQITDEADYDKRALYYWAKLYTEQLQESKDYSKLSKAIGIHILNFLSIPGIEKYHNVFHITEKESGMPFFKELELHTIELKKFSGASDTNLSDLVKKVKSALDMWAAFLTNDYLLKIDKLPKKLQDPNLQKAITVLDVMNLNEEERDIYEGKFKWFMIEQNTLKKAKNDGRIEGMIEGETIGIEKGKIEGKMEAAVAIAKTMLSKGIDIQIVAEITGLDVTELRKYL